MSLCTVPLPSPLLHISASAPHTEKSVSCVSRCRNSLTVTERPRGRGVGQQQNHAGRRRGVGRACAPQPPHAGKGPAAGGKATGSTCAPRVLTLLPCACACSLFSTTGRDEARGRGGAQRAGRWHSGWRPGWRMMALGCSRCFPRPPSQLSKHDAKVDSLNTRYGTALQSVANRRKQGYEAIPIKWDIETADAYINKLRTEQQLDSTISGQ